MKLKITRSILIKGRFQFPGSIIEATPHQASDFLNRGCAIIHREPEPEAQPAPEPKPKRSKKNDPEHTTATSEAKDAGASR